MKTQGMQEIEMRILTVLTSHDQLDNTGRKTGFWALLTRMARKSASFSPPLDDRCGLTLPPLCRQR